MAHAPTPSPRWLAKRRAGRASDARAAQWEAIRTAGPQPGGPTYPTLPGASPSSHPAYAPLLPLGPPPVSRPMVILSAVAPVAAAVVLVVSATAGLPVFSGQWSPVWLVAGLVLAAGCLLGARAAWQRAPQARAARVTGLAIAGTLLAVFAVGTATQVVVDGTPQLVGTQGEQTSRTGDRILVDAATLRDNQKLLRLPVEQASTLLTVFDEAVAQSTSIAARWNPATAGELPTPSLLAAYAALNTAASRQAEALAAQKQNLLSPDEKLAAGVAARYRDVESALGTGPGSILAMVDAAYREAGFTGVPDGS